MADAATLEAPEADAHADDHGHHDHDHHPSLAHHFEHLDQQFDAGKLGTWLFLAQEVLFFSGLFTAYTVYRYHHPEVFVDAHHHLNTTLGAINTIVLLASSLAIAWGVRAAMLGDRRTILNTHVFTLGCAALFMGIKAIEYTHKWDEGIGAGSLYSYVEGAHASHYWGSWMPAIAIGSLLLGGVVTLLGAGWASAGKLVTGWVVGSLGVCVLSFGFGIVVAKCVMPTEAELAMQHGGAHGADHAAHGDSHAADSHANDTHAADTHSADTHGADTAHGEEHAPAEEAAAEEAAAAEPAPPTGRFGAPNFFAIYFIMTGIHAVHIIGGIIAILWVVAKAAAGEFSPEYFLPVECVGLYWHLVDLVWIYLFPLMYLIH